MFTSLVELVNRFPRAGRKRRDTLSLSFIYLFLFFKCLGSFPLHFGVLSPLHNLASIKAMTIRLTEYVIRPKIMFVFVRSSTGSDDFIRRVKFLHFPKTLANEQYRPKIKYPCSPKRLFARLLFFTNASIVDCLAILLIDQNIHVGMKILHGVFK